MQCSALCIPATVLQLSQYQFPSTAHSCSHEQALQNVSMQRFWFLQAAFKVTVMKGTGDTDSIAQIICHQAEDLGVSLVVMAAHNKGRQVKYIVGTVTEYCTHHCGKTVLVMH